MMNQLDEQMKLLPALECKYMGVKEEWEGKEKRRGEESS